MSIAVGVEEHRIDIFADAVGGKHRRVRCDERTVLLLQQHAAGLPFGAAGIDVIKSITIHITNRQRRPFGREQVRHQRFAIHVVEVILDMPIAGPDAVGHIHQQRRRGAMGRVVPHTMRIALRQREAPIGRHLRHDLKFPIGPDHDQRVDHRVAAKAEVQPLIHGRLEAARRALFEELSHAFLHHGQLAADPGCVLPRTVQRHHQPRVARPLPRKIAINGRWRIVIVDHQIERTIVVEIHVCGAIRVTHLRQAPRLRHVGEVQVTVVTIGVILHRHRRHLLQKRHVRLCHAMGQRLLYLRVAEVVDVVQIVWPAEDSAGHEQILQAVVVEIREQQRPGPVGRIDARQKSDLTEHPVTAIELQRIARILGVVSGANAQIEQAVRLRAGR